MFLGLNGAVVAVFAAFLYNIEIPFILLVAAFLITFSVYSLNMATDVKEDAINRSGNKQTKAISYLVPSVASMVVSIAIGITQGVSTLLILVAPLFIGAIYSIRITKLIPRLKEITGVKSIVVALSWAITGAFLPATITPIALQEELLVFLYIFAQILVNTIVFDALDIRGDRASGIVTIPVALGKKKTKRLLLIINGSLVIWIIYCLLNGIFVTFMPTLAFGVLFEGAIIWYFLKKDRPRLHAELMVDGEWLPLVVMMRLLIR